LREHSTTDMRLKGDWASEAKAVSGFVAPGRRIGVTNFAHTRKPRSPSQAR
jgi:hypothetical protein